MRLIVLLVVLVDTTAFAITFFGSAKVPSTESGSNAGAPATFANPPVASMVTNDYIVVVVVSRTTTDTLTNTTTGGQTWTAETAVNQTLNSTRVFHARFNGTWSAAPVFNCAGANTCTAYMMVFRDVDASTALDTAVVGSSFAAPSSPFNVANPGLTTATDNAMVEYVWTSADDNTWALQAGGPTLTQVEPMWRNLAGTDNSVSVGYGVIATAGASGSKTNQQTANGGDAGVVYAIALRATTTTTSTTTTTTTSTTTTTVPAGCVAVDYQAGVGASPFGDAAPDTMLSSQTPTAAQGASVSMNLGTLSGVFVYRPVLQFNLSTGVAGTINDAYVILVATAGGGGPGSVTRLLRSDWDEATATWNVYKSATNWTTAGASDDGTDFTSSGAVSFGTPPAAAGPFTITGLGPLTQDALDNRAGALILRLRVDNEAAGGIEVFASSEATTAANRPQLHVVYCTTTTTATTSTSTSTTVPPLAGRPRRLFVVP